MDLYRQGGRICRPPRPERDQEHLGTRYCLGFWLRFQVEQFIVDRLCKRPI
jgi:hypothetical protein